MCRSVRVQRWTTKVKKKRKWNTKNQLPFWLERAHEQRYHTSKVRNEKSSRSISGCVQVVAQPNKSLACCAYFVYRVCVIKTTFASWTRFRLRLDIKSRALAQSLQLYTNETERQRKPKWNCRSKKSTQKNQLHWFISHWDALRAQIQAFECTWVSQRVKNEKRREKDQFEKKSNTNRVNETRQCIRLWKINYWDENSWVRKGKRLSEFRGKVNEEESKSNIVSSLSFSFFFFDISSNTKQRWRTCSSFPLRSIVFVSDVTLSWPTATLQCDMFDWICALFVVQQFRQNTLHSIMASIKSENAKKNRRWKIIHRNIRIRFIYSLKSIVLQWKIYKTFRYNVMSCSFVSHRNERDTQ